MTTIVVAPLANYPAGTFPLSEFAVGDSIVQIKASIARCTNADPTIWPSNTVSFTANLDFFDGSQWIDKLFFFSDVGGIRSKLGIDYPASYAIWSLPAGTGRKLRGSIIIGGGTLRSSVTVDVT